MLELGETGPALHNDLAPLAEGIDVVHTVGPLMAAAPFETRAISAFDSAELAHRMGRQVRAGDVVMVKGSLGMKMALVIDALKKLGDAGASDITGGVE